MITGLESEWPARIGRYAITGPVHAGGFATVYRAIDDQLDAPVAIKLLHREHAFDPEVRARFIQEGQLLRKVACGALVAVHEMGEMESGQPYLILDFADRGDLRTRVEQCKLSNQIVTADDALIVAQILATALGRMHHANIVHRDIKPANLLIFSGSAKRPGDGLLDFDEELKLADLGLAKDLAESSGLTVGATTDHHTSQARMRPGWFRRRPGTGPPMSTPLGTGPPPPRRIRLRTIEGWPLPQRRWDWPQC